MLQNLFPRSIWSGCLVASLLAWWPIATQATGMGGNNSGEPLPLQAAFISSFGILIAVIVWILKNQFSTIRDQSKATMEQNKAVMEQNKVLGQLNVTLANWHTVCTSFHDEIRPYLPAKEVVK